MVKKECNNIAGNVLLSLLQIFHRSTFVINCIDNPLTFHSQNIYDHLNVVVVGSIMKRCLLTTAHHYNPCL